MLIDVKFARSVVARAMIAAAICGAVASAARAGEGSSGPGIFDTVLEKLQIKAKPAEPPPDFVRETRPDAAGLDYMQRPTPHKVSPIPTKSADEVQATKDALDAARDAQLNPPPPAPITPAAPAGKRGARKKAPN